jgi:type IV pilus assembly protein PilA
VNIQEMYCSLSRYRKNKEQFGFTLIELLVVMTLIAALSAMALPSLLAQIGKARESEGKTTIGSVNRAQQAFHFEKNTFADGIDLESPGNGLGVVVEPEFYSFTVDGDDDNAQVTAAAIDGFDDAVRNYAGGIGYSGGSYNTVLCQSDETDGAASADTTVIAACVDGTEIN